MEQVKKQTVEELISITTKWLELHKRNNQKDYGDLSRIRFRQLIDNEADRKTGTAMILQNQCNRTMEFYEFEDIARLVCCDYDRKIENPFEAFSKIIAILGVEVDE